MIERECLNSKTMAYMTGFLIIVWHFLQPCTGHSMTLEQMKKMKGAEMIDLRVSDVFSAYGLPAVITDHGDKINATKKTIRWANEEMRLSDDDWDLVYRNEYKIETASKLNGWANPDPVMPARFSGLLKVVFSSQGRNGFIEFDKRLKKTIYKIPANRYKAHKITGVRVELGDPIPVTEITKKYGMHHDIVVNQNRNVLRYWVLVQNGLMPVSLYAVDFEVNNTGDASSAYSIANNSFGFVQKKFEAFHKEWEEFNRD